MLMWREVWLEFCHKPIRPTKPNPVIEIDLIQVVLGIVSYNCWKSGDWALIYQNGISGR